VTETVSVRNVLRAASDRLRAGGVGSPEHDARLLLAHVAGWKFGEVILHETIAADRAREFEALVVRRAGREPLQHLTGRAWFRHVEVEVGPGVFVPRPETEVMSGWAVAQILRLTATGTIPLVVELCAGSGVISLAIANEVSEVRQHAVELSPDAARWAERNLAGTGIQLHVEDMTDALPDLDGTVDLVIANPPYIPLDAYLSVAPEGRNHDPALALFAGVDGLDAIRTVARVAARLLRSGGLLACEHADVQGNSARAVLVQAGAFTRIHDHPDLVGRSRFVTAVRR
jgi:release factor glutamine methyltransferase